MTVEVKPVVGVSSFEKQRYRRVWFENMKKIDDRKREKFEKIILKKAEKKDDSTHSMKSPKRSKNIAEFM